MSAASTSRRARRLRSARGFTLVELMVSLVAGVIIAIAVIGLAKAATTTFYEQARLASVEQTARNAANRLRQDLTKVSFMGTGNIHLATTPDVPYGHRVASQFAVAGNAGSRYGTLARDLQGIRVHVMGSFVGPLADPRVTVYGNELKNLTKPDAIDIGGNLTTDDWYIGSWDNTQAGTCGGGVFFVRTLADPAAERLLGDPANAAANVTNAFTPGPANTRYWARVVDSLGCQHFVEVMNAAVTADGFSINLCNGSDGNSLLMPGAARAGCGATPVTDETLRISPFQRVRWRIGQTPAAMAAALDPPAAIAPAQSTFMLLRETLKSDNTVVAPLTQIVAEFAIDLKFGLAVDQRESQPTNTIGFFDLDSDTTGPGGGGNIDSWTKPASTTILSTTTQSNPGPQRVRSVKFRISTRASIPDRTQSLTVAPGPPYVTRYCVDTPACTKYARVRTIVSEVPLLNQARMTY